MTDSENTLDPPLRPSCSKNTKTDQTHGRSVALLAQLHPKCPFQAELLRVRASYCCFLVLGYYEVPGLYGYGTELVNTAPYLSLDRFEGRRFQVELLFEAGCVVAVLLSRRSMGTADPIEPQQRNLN
jgi:hypothetical protein